MGQQAKCLHNPRVLVPNGGKHKDGTPQLVCGDCQKAWRNKDYRQHLIRAMLQNAKQRACQCGVSFDLTAMDIVIPERCPVLGIELGIGTWGHTDCSPSLDRFDASLGYVRGNVAVISNRANRLKGDGTLAEHEALVRWMHKSGV